MLSQSFFTEDTTNNSKVLYAIAFGDALVCSHHTESNVMSNKLGQHPPNPHEVICQLFLDIVKRYSPEAVLLEFDRLFINPVGTINSESHKALKQITLANNEQEFRGTLKRCIYILLNNWIFTRKYQPAIELVEKLSFYQTKNSSDSTSFTSFRHLKLWLANFVNSEDYQEIKLFVSRYENRDRTHWKNRYTSYLLTPQYVNQKNLLEQRQAAKRLSAELQEQYKFDLAMYTARCQCPISSEQRTQNPTALGEEALRLVKKLVTKRGAFSYANLANIFRNQTTDINYENFKQSLIRYLIYSVDNQGLAENLKTKLTRKIEAIYQSHNEEKLNETLMLKTCTRVIEFLTSERNGEPSSLFISMASQGNPLTLAVILLKLTLLCSHSRTHLEVCIAKLIKHYENYDQSECQWLINFLEICQLILTIYTENVRYNLVNMENDTMVNQPIFDDNAYRVFSQVKSKV
ncbi:MAG TPA: hypothetical protein V6D28_10840 [Leptolyngbyaceae cyanobacterium]